MFLKSINFRKEQGLKLEEFSWFAWVFVEHVSVFALE